MGKTTRKQSFDAGMEEGDDIVLKIIEALTNEHVLSALKKALYPQQ